MKKPLLRLVVDNSLVVKDQPFNTKVIVTNDEMKDLRSGFAEWFHKDDPRLAEVTAKDRECILCEMGVPLVNNGGR